MNRSYLLPPICAAAISLFIIQLYHLTKIPPDKEIFGGYALLISLGLALIVPLGFRNRVALRYIAISLCWYGIFIFIAKFIILTAGTGKGILEMMSVIWEPHASAFSSLSVLVISSAILVCLFFDKDEIADGLSDGKLLCLKAYLITVLLAPYILFLSKFSYL